MRKLAWVGRGVSAVSGALLLGALMVPSAAAYSTTDAATDPKSTTRMDPKKEKKCLVPRHVASTAFEFGQLNGSVFRVANDRKGHAFLSDPRNPGVWVNLGLVPGTPDCVADVAVAAVDSTLNATVVEVFGYLNITLLAANGRQYEAQCAVTNYPFSHANIPSACGSGFTQVAGTPV
ncbi:hypothetical protein [Streptomyces sp. NPDC090022]|uniref:hypothetical protein n=1 Tax=Streptomyces sp. NPDC090022 TaxID=3365920 RepID=UPI0037F87C12